MGAQHPLLVCFYKWLLHLDKARNEDFWFYFRSIPHKCQVGK